jgi:hypothetical protein
VETCPFERLIRTGFVAFALADSASHAFHSQTPDCLAEPGAGGFRLLMHDPKLAEMLVGAHPDSLVMQLRWRRPSIALRHPENSVDAANEWKRAVVVNYDVSASRLKQMKATYRSRYAERRRFLSKTFSPRKRIATLLCFVDSASVAFFDLQGRRISDSQYAGYVSEKHRKTIDSRSLTSFGMPTSFALCGEHLFFGDVSLFDQLTSGPLRTICEGIGQWRGEYGIYYTDVNADPTGRYIAVCGANGSGWAFLWDVDHAKVARELYEDELVWDEDGAGVSQQDEWFSATSSQQVSLGANYGTQKNGEVYNEGYGFLNKGKVYWLTWDAIMMRPLNADANSKVKISSVNYMRSDNEFDRTRIVGFVSGNVLVRNGSKVLLCNDSGILSEIDAGPEFAHGRVSLQYIFERRKPSR